ncbi:tRNA 2-selenouridine(34) synthase MnmH [Paenibacillus sp. FSL R5-0527]|uniref:tRNA 2-selenouridine(34) synthase MnmH n=1 Tax=Paenibacillus sp. FSL R5-0527 TaxID=2975321 RepID=UPI00097A7361|nr:tRNA 2-selenouridine(34) synthase MnmH [Paenibacillus macerans]
MFQDLSLEEWVEQRQKGLSLIDVRSPSEFAQSTIPGSVNIPLFDDRERAEIGTLYKQVSAEAAKQRGLEIVSAKLPGFIRKFAEIPGRKAVFCWRGGMRSKTTATLLSLMDIHAYRLAGGYRAYRQWVVGTLENMSFAPQMIVIHGNTGSGKTLLLRTLKEKGYPVIDLEEMAGHRGSAFGQIGLKSRNQKMFDSLLVDDLLRYRDELYVLMEAESKRIGKAVMPEFLAAKKEQGRHIRLELPLEVRVKIILEDYEPWKHPEACLESFRKIKSKIHIPVAAEIESCLTSGKYDRAVELLLAYYYDPRYAHTEDQYADAEFAVVRAASVEEAAAEVERLLPKPAPLAANKP